MRSKVLYILLTAFLIAVILCGISFSDRIFASTIQAVPTSSDEPVSSDCNHSSDAFCSHLPLLLIQTKGSGIEYGVPHWSEISLINNKNGKNHTEDNPLFTTASTIWIRGQSSSRFEKKSYGIEFFKEQESIKRRDLSILGMAADSDWVLHGPYLDKSLMRNHLSYHIARQSMFWAPETRYVEMFLDGSYEGIYLIVESPRVRETRIPFADYALLSGETAYLLQRNRVNTDTTALNCFGSYTGKVFYPLYIRYPIDRNLTAAQSQWITADISRFERALYSDYFKDSRRGYKAYINMDSFATYYVIAEFSMNKDSGFLSTYCCKNIGGKLMMGPVWDFNNGFDHYPGYPTDPGPDGDGFYIADNNWYERLMQDPAFVEVVIAKYREMRQTVLSTKFMLQFIDETEEYLGDSINRNFERWSYSFVRNFLGGHDENGNSRELSSHADAIKQLKKTIVARGLYLDEHIELLYHYCDMN
ncbi:MAG: CotH kinase family protein [Clostridia bacterium]